MIDRIARWFFGDDVFISYGRADATAYASSLANELAGLGLSCRFDRWGSQPGQKVPRELVRALGRSGALVVLGTRGAATSESVAQEVKTFVPTGRPIIPVDVDGSLRESLWWPVLDGLPVSREAAFPESQEHSGSTPQRPSPTVIHSIESALNFTKRNRRIQRTAWVTMLVLALLLAGATLVTIKLRESGAELGRQQERVEVVNQQLADVEQLRTQAQGELETAQARLSETDSLLQATRHDYETQVTLTTAAREERVEAERLRDQARREAASNQLAVQASNLVNDRFDLSLLLSAEAYTIAPTPEAELSLLRTLQHDSRLIGHLHGHGGLVYDVAFSRYGDQLVSASSDGRVIVWDVETGGADTISGIVGQPRHVEYGTDGLSVVVATYGGGVFNWPGHDQSAVHTVKDTFGFASVAIGPDGTYVTTSHRELAVWQVGDPAAPQLKTFSTAVGAGAAVAVSPGGDRVSSGGSDGVVRLWDLREVPPVPVSLQHHDGEVLGLAFSPGGRILASAGRDGLVLLWDLQGDSVMGELAGHGSFVFDFVFSPDGKTLASASYDKTVVLWDVEALQAVGEPLRHGGFVYGVDFSPDGKRVATASYDGIVRLWQTEREKVFAFPLGSHPDEVWSVAFNPDGSAVASAGRLGRLLVWEAHRRRSTPRLLSTQGPTFYQVDFSSDGEWLASAQEGGEIVLWSLRADAPSPEPILGHALNIRSITFDAGWNRLAVGGFDGGVSLLDLRSRRIGARSLSGHSSSVLRVAFDEEGERLASGDESGELAIWSAPDVDSLALLQKVAAHRGPIFGVAFDPLGAWLASAAYDQESSLAVWDLTRGAPLVPPIPFDEGGAVALAVRPDGRRLAVGTSEGLIVLLETQGWRQIGSLSGHSGYVSELEYDSTGQFLVSAGSDGAVILWSMNPCAWVEKARRLASRELSREEKTRYIGALRYEASCAPTVAEPGPASG